MTDISAMGPKELNPPIGLRSDHDTHVSMVGKGHAWKWSASSAASLQNAFGQLRKLYVHTSRLTGHH